MSYPLVVRRGEREASEHGGGRRVVVLDEQIELAAGHVGGSRREAVGTRQRHRAGIEVVENESCLSRAAAGEAQEDRAQRGEACAKRPMVQGRKPTEKERASVELLLLRAPTTLPRLLCELLHSV